MPVKVTFSQTLYASYHAGFEEVALAADREAHDFQTGNSFIQYQIYGTTGQQVYLRDYQPVRTLRRIRSSSKHLLTANITETVLATRGFRHSAVAVWNSLPNRIRDSSNIDHFKRKVKTHLFDAAFVA